MFAMVGQPDTQLLTAFAREAEQRVADFEAHDVAGTALAFATASRSDA